METLVQRGEPKTARKPEEESEPKTARKPEEESEPGGCWGKPAAPQGSLRFGVAFYYGN